MPAEIMVLPTRIMFQNDLPDLHTAVYCVYQNAFDVADVVIVLCRNERWILGQKVAEQRDAAVARGCASEILSWIRVWI